MHPLFDHPDHREGIESTNSHRTEACVRQIRFRLVSTGSIVFYEREKAERSKKKQKKPSKTESISNN